MNLTISDIEADIQEFEARISSARDKLAALPKGYLTYQEHKKREKQCQGLQADISHYENLIKYAHEGIAILHRVEN